MARPERNNVDYFPFLCKEGKAMFYIEQKYSNDGYATWVKILRQLAVTNYHFLNLNDKVEFMFLASKCRISEELLSNIIHDLCELGEFHNDLWHQNKVIWSEKFYESVQDAYLNRKNNCMGYEGLLQHLQRLGIVKPQKTQVNNTVNTQTILYNKKLEENRVEQNLAELRSAYEKLQKSKELICNFIKDKNPEFIEPYSDLWNLFAEKYKMAKVEKLSDGRKKKLKTRLSEKSFNFIEIIRKLNNANDFTLTQQWLTFDWVIESEKNYTKILEGNYDKKENSSQHEEPVKDFENITAWQNCKLYEYSELTENIQSIYSEDFWIKWQKFNAYIDKSCPNIRKIDKQVEILEYKQLKEEFIDTGKLTTEAFLQTLNNFDNHKQASEKYISVYKAIKSWLTK